MKDKVAIVTGGAGGIGGAICQRFAARRARVVVADVDAAASESVAAAIEAGGGSALAVRVDVTDESSVISAVGGGGRGVWARRLPGLLRREQHQGADPGPVPGAVGEHPGDAPYRRLSVLP